MLLNYLLGRFKEHTSWYGLLLVIGSFGLHFTPEQQEAIIYFGMAIMGAPDLDLSKALPKVINGVKAIPKVLKGGK